MTRKSPRLSELQEWMRWVLTHPKGVKAALQMRHPRSGCLNVIGETPEVNRATRLSIYGNGYFWRIIEVLGSTFSSVKNVIGSDAFDGIARRYLVAHPSTFKSIDDIGGSMAAFLRKQPLSRRFPYLFDLATLEWAAHRTFFADDLPPIPLKKLKDIPASNWPAIKITLDNAVRLITFEWRITDLWRANGKWSRQQLARLKKRRQHVMLFRLPEKFLRAPELTPVQFALLKQLQSGKTLKVALATAARHPNAHRDLANLQEWFEAWARNGVIRSVKVTSR